MTRGMQTYQSLAQKNQHDELILSHLALVKHVLGRLAVDLPPGVDTENLESAGVLGLVAVLLYERPRHTGYGGAPAPAAAPAEG